MNNLDPLNVSSTELAEVLGMTRQRVSQLRSAGAIANNGKRGRYDLGKAISAYLQYLQDNKHGDADVRLKIEQERKLRLQNDKTEAGLVNVTDAAQAFELALSQFRSIATSRIKGMAAKISKTDNPRAAGKIMQIELNAIGQAAFDGLQQVEEYER